MYISFSVQIINLILGTDDLKTRVLKHEKGYVQATKDRRPIKLHCYFAFPNKYTEFNFERYLKSGSGRAFLKNHKILE